MKAKKPTKKRTDWKEIAGSREVWLEAYKAERDYWKAQCARIEQKVCEYRTVVERERDELRAELEFVRSDRDLLRTKLEIARKGLADMRQECEMESRRSLFGFKLRQLFKLRSNAKRTVFTEAR